MYYSVTRSNAVAMKLDRLRFSAAASLSIRSMRSAGREIEICVLPGARFVAVLPLVLVLLVDFLGIIFSQVMFYGYFTEDRLNLTKLKWWWEGDSNARTDYRNRFTVCVLWPLAYPTVTYVDHSVCGSGKRSVVGLSANLPSVFFEKITFICIRGNLAVNHCDASRRE